MLARAFIRALVQIDKAIDKALDPFDGNRRPLYLASADHSYFEEYVARRFLGAPPLRVVFTLAISTNSCETTTAAPGMGAAMGIIRTGRVGGIVHVAFFHKCVFISGGEVTKS
jgi:hypothetical protein